MTIGRSGADLRMYVAVPASEIGRAETTLISVPCRSVDQRLRPENDREREALGVLRLGFGGIDHDAQVVGRDDERVAVQRDVPDVGVVDHLVAPELLVWF